MFDPYKWNGQYKKDLTQNYITYEQALRLGQTESLYKLWKRRKQPEDKRKTHTKYSKLATVF